MIRLTDEETLASMGTSSVGCLACGMWIGRFRESNKAQLKKVLDITTWVGGVAVIDITYEDWQVLLEEEK